MKVLLVIHHWMDEHSGAPGSIHTLAGEYERLGHDVDVLSYDSLPGWTRPLPPILIFPLFVVVAVIRRHRSMPLDVVDASTGDAWLWPLTRILDAGPLLVTHSHGLEHLLHNQLMAEVKRGHQTTSWKYPLYRGGFHLWEVEQSLHCADLVFFLNADERRYAVQELGVDRAKCTIVRHGIPRSFLGLDVAPSTDPIRIAYIGSYIQRKGIRYMRPAIESVLQAVPSVQMSFFGTGCSADTVLRDYDPCLHERIAVVPRYERDQLPERLDGHHIHLFPTLSEGLGIVLLEAMACGLTPVTTRTPGPTEIVTDGKTGLLIPPRDSNAIEDALRSLITHRDRLDRLRRNARDSVQDYTWENAARERLHAYDAALTARASENAR
jgi:glycosyltransferase involved in cell wall biosynthesis